MKLNRILNNIRDIVNNPKQWYYCSKLFLNSLIIPYQEKIRIIEESSKIASNLLAEKGIDCPFIVSINSTKDDLFRTSATYQNISFENGLIEIGIKEQFITNNRNLIVHDILHEYSHAIFESSIHDLYLIDAIIRLEPFINQYQINDQFIPEGIPGLGDLEKKIEDFCEWFAYYIEKRIVFGNDKIQVNYLCRIIIDRFQLLYHSRYKKNE